MAINQVFLYVPNLIGYVRFILYLASFISHSLGYWQLCIGLYAIAFILDEFDGRAARAYNQSSNFGAALDMVADRSATAGLCLILAQLYPHYLLAFIGAIALDISSHKDSAQWSNNGLLKLYYGNKFFMDLLILGNELFYLLLYLDFYLVGMSLNLAGWQTNIWQLALIVCLPIYLLKQTTNILQLQTAGQEIAKLDLDNRESKSAAE